MTLNQEQIIWLKGWLDQLEQDPSQIQFLRSELYEIQKERQMVKRIILSDENRVLAYNNYGDSIIGLQGPLTDSLKSLIKQFTTKETIFEKFQNDQRTPLTVEEFFAIQSPCL